jgi:hypothetical protein
LAEGQDLDHFVKFLLELTSKIFRATGDVDVLFQQGGIKFPFIYESVGVQVDCVVNYHAELVVGDFGGKEGWVVVFQAKG